MVRPVHVAIGFYFDRGKMDVKNEVAKTLTIKGPGGAS